ncbi:MCE family protein [Nocardioides coralli]|uniref:MCE family protein n=1 Tax=Nocardioides coralli TaxID=2872154 RepID=UPI001CA3F7B2|nr:MCE family protein [Nocardioides coralli]QZY29539.1 MCE family protein [Nocardioides coralli]
MKKLIVPGVLLALLAAAAVTMLGGEDQKTLTAKFPRTISVYEGSDVRVLGVPVGTVDTVTPSGTEVVVTMSYDREVTLPADAKAVIISPSVVGDRYVQLTPTYGGGEKLADGATLEVEQTAVPLELDEIYDNLDKLNVALGPTGANREGALSDLLQVTADNFGGQGEKFNETIRNFGRFSETLADNRQEFFGSMRALQGFISTLASNDETVRDFNDSLSEVSSMLSGERQELKAALENLSVAMGEVSTFVQENRDILGRNIRGLNRVSKVLAKQRGALDEILSAAPVALNNLALTYNPQAGTLDTRANLGELDYQITSDPAVFLCGIVNQADTSGDTCDAIEAAFPRAGALRTMQGKNPRWQDESDPSLGGLVEVTR